MVNYRSNKTRYKVDELGSLYVDESKINDNEQPIIYIGGQMEHRGHILEQTGFTKDLNHSLYTGSWMYDYPVTKSNKKRINGINFSENLLRALKEAKLREVLLVTHSFGGTIGAYASKSNLIDKVISIHPPILGTPLAYPESIIHYRKYLTKKQRLLTAFLRLIVNYEYGFEKDNYYGVDLKKVDLNKLLVVGNHIDTNSETNKLILETYQLIKVITKKENDGVILFHPQEFNSLGINYLQTLKHCNHFQSSNTEYIKNIVDLVRKK